MAKKLDCLKMKRERDRVKDEMDKQKQKTASSVMEFTSEDQEVQPESPKAKEINKVITDVSNQIRKEKAQEAKLEKVEPEIPVSEEPMAEPMAESEPEAPVTSQEMFQRLDEMRQDLANADRSYNERRNLQINRMKQLEEEARQKAENERRARIEAETNARMQRELEKAAEESKRLEQLEASKSSKKPHIAAVYRYMDPELKTELTTFDMWVAEQASPHNWKMVYVLIEDGCVTRELTNAELAEKFSI